MDNEILTSNGMEFHPIYCTCQRSADRLAQIAKQRAESPVDNSNRVTLE